MQISAREVICKKRALVKNLSVNLETSAQTTFADYTALLLEPDNLSEPERRTPMSALQTKRKNCTKT